MELYIGGYAQGKTDYVRKLYPNAQMEERYDGVCETEVFIWNHFHLAIKQLMAEGKSKEEILELVWHADDNCGKLVIVSDEIGNGIVPLEKEDRLYREETGRILCRIAQRSEKVERIVCGIAQRIK